MGLTAFEFATVGSALGAAEQSIVHHHNARCEAAGEQWAEHYGETRSSSSCGDQSGDAGMVRTVLSPELPPPQDGFRFHHLN